MAEQDRHAPHCLRIAGRAALLPDCVSDAPAKCSEIAERLRARKGGGSLKNPRFIPGQRRGIGRHVLEDRPRASLDRRHVDRERAVRIDRFPQLAFLDLSRLIRRVDRGPQRRADLTLGPGWQIAADRSPRLIGSLPQPGNLRLASSIGRRNIARRLCLDACHTRRSSSVSIGSLAL